MGDALPPDHDPGSEVTLSGRYDPPYCQCKLLMRHCGTSRGSSGNPGAAILAFNFQTASAVT